MLLRSAATPTYQNSVKAGAGKLRLLVTILVLLPAPLASHATAPPAHRGANHDVSNQIRHGLIAQAGTYAARTAAGHRLANSPAGTLSSRPLSNAGQRNARQFQSLQRRLHQRRQPLRRIDCTRQPSGGQRPAICDQLDNGIGAASSYQQ